MDGKEDIWIAHIQMKKYSTSLGVRIAKVNKIEYVKYL